MAEGRNPFIYISQSLLTCYRYLMPVVLHDTLFGDELVEEKIWPRLRDSSRYAIAPAAFFLRVHVGEIGQVLAHDDEVHRAFVGDLELVERQGLAALVQSVRNGKLLRGLRCARLDRHLNRHRPTVPGEGLRHETAVVASGRSTRTWGDSGRWALISCI